MEADTPLTGEALVKEVCRRIRRARSYWDAHNNLACRTERDRAMKLYDTLTRDQKEEIPQVLRVWLRYRSEKYFGDHRTAPGSQRKAKKPSGGGAGKKGSAGAKNKGPTPGKGSTNPQTKGKPDSTKGQTGKV